MSDPNQAVDETGPELGAPASAAAAPPYIGRYRVERLLGRGGFGRVYLAHDEQLQRRVAVKTPHPERVEHPGDAEAYLSEARAVANLDHPNIVPVHDVGGTTEFPCFIVSKYIDGADLSARIKQSRLPPRESVELTATVAEALHHAHKQGLVHRDVKPGNILLDKTGRPYVADFGLALREQDVGRGPRYAGTPEYMSPEQARGEGHRVDGRSDVFSLGVVFYQLLTGRRPFQGKDREELLEQITGREVRPPRQWDDAIPRELERICLKALSKRASERYTTAKDMADDLRCFLAGASVEETSELTGRAQREAESATPVATPATPPASDGQPVRIVPKGLRSFDEGDADFFLDLVPGPRDRDGLPDGIRFWKGRIAPTEAENTFAVGLIYGPSGCGKSSLVRAGLLPRLANSVQVVYVEATGDETEARLLKGLRRRVPDLPRDLSLGESLAGLRRGRWLEPGRKVLLVLDQFEQWLHAKRGEENAELVQALRQCDGGRLQAVVLVRDDFWLAVSRFMQALEITPDGNNSRLVDLFDLRHARKVLAAFGRAFGALPDKEPTGDQNAFLDQAVAGLAQDGKVISVRLALFAEMVKGKPWTPAALKEVGGTEGVGVAFLEETFAASTAPPQHRLHQKAAQAVLKALLPESGTDIKGHMRSRQELLEASGYGGRPRDFDDLQRILDAELRLITPTDPEGKADGEPSTLPDGARFYQLTHDYLVPSLRDWLTRKQKETRRGRAELLLADRAAVWNARPENRQLPSLAQWLRIRWLTDGKKWTRPQRQMMGKAAWVHGLRAAALLLAVLLLGWVGYEVYGRLRAESLVESIATAETAEAPALVNQLPAYRRWADARLAQRLHDSAEDSKEHLNLSMALLPADQGQAQYLYRRLLEAGPNELPVIRDALFPRRQEFAERLWGVLEDGKDDAGRRFRAACALAGYDATEDDANRKRWEATAPFVADRLLVAVQNNPSDYKPLLKTLDPIRGRLIGRLSEVFRGAKSAESDRVWAANLLAECAADRMDVLAELLLDADEKEFAPIFTKYSEQGEQGVAPLTAEIDKKPPADLPSADPTRETLAKRQANAAVALLRMNHGDKVWPLLMRRDRPGRPDDPRVRSYVIHRLSPLGADPGAIIKRLEEEPDVAIRRALFLSLGEFDEEQLPSAARDALLPKLKDIYGNDADPGLHAAVEWLLRLWKQADWLQQTNDKWAKNEKERNQRIETIRQLVSKDGAKAPPQWYVNGQGQTMVVIPGPVEFLMGSPPTEDGRAPDESQHKRRIGRTYCLAAAPVTVAAFQRFLKENKLEKWFDGGGQVPPLMKKNSPDEDGPIILVDWYHAAAYCNWLSKAEGVREEQWCYETDAQGRVTGLKAGYLGLAGYRLPTEAEWEYACRAGAATSRSYGETAELLEGYGWYLTNSGERARPVGGKKPNDLGLFAMHGDVWNWCQESYKGDYDAPENGAPLEDKEDTLQVESQQGRVLRGGSFVDQASFVRSANRIRLAPTNRYYNVGFRPARTFIP